jgi:diaminohydroxyphosphoribosylaminopyrimidine deaminase/5-amino-6-(5-phosphoribosylamino)uracil reductase
VRLQTDIFEGKMGVMDFTGDNREADERFMRRALALARNAWGETHPNPLVGAVIATADGVVLGEGWHKKAGGPHAEINALTSAGEKARGATLYVTLEPCSTYGRTPPCTEAIKRAGIARVVVGATDPNPAHAGRGYDILRAAGIEVTGGVLADDCADLNPIFNHWIARCVPLFAGKLATTLDGHIATRTGDSKWITGPAARENVHLWRRYFPAIAVGNGTVLKDNPALTSRLPGKSIFCPLRFVFDRTLRTAAAPTLPNLYTDEFRAKTTVFTTPEAPRDRQELLRGQGVNLVTLPGSGDPVFWRELRGYCKDQNVNGVLFEGGSKVLSSLLAANELDYFFAYRAPVFLADAEALPAFDGAAPDTIRDGWRLTNVRNEVFGPDSLMRGFISKPESAR